MSGVVSLTRHCGSTEVVFIGTTHRTSDEAEVGRLLRVHDPDVVCVEARPDHGLDGTADYSAVEHYATASGARVKLCDVGGVTPDDLESMVGEDTLDEIQKMSKDDTLSATDIRTELRDISERAFQFLIKQREAEMAANIRSTIPPKNDGCVAVVVGKAHMNALAQQVC